MAKDAELQEVADFLAASAGKTYKDAVTVGREAPLGWMPTGIAALDFITNPDATSPDERGYPRGKIIEIFGAWQSGKSLLLLKAMQQAQKDGQLCVLWDVEDALDQNFAGKVGVDVDRLVLPEFQTAELVFDSMVALIKRQSKASNRKKYTGLFYGVDSVAEMTTEHEMKTDMSKRDMMKAYQMGAGLRRLRGVLRSVNRTGFPVTVIFINQIREKVGVLFGNNETTPGGRALPHAAHMRIRCEARKAVKSGKRIIGATLALRIVKSRMSRQFASCEIVMDMRKGVHPYSGLADALSREGIDLPDGANKASWFCKHQEVLTKYGIHAYGERSSQAVQGKAGSDAKITSVRQSGRGLKLSSKRRLAPIRRRSP